jgi:hypothetical protein
MLSDNLKRECVSSGYRMRFGTSSRSNRKNKESSICLSVLAVFLRRHITLIWNVVVEDIRQVQKGNVFLLVDLVDNCFCVGGASANKPAYWV